MQTMRERCYGNQPTLLEAYQFLKRWIARCPRKDVAARHEHGRRESVCLILSTAPVRCPCVTMENQMTEFVNRIMATPLAGFHGVQKDVRFGAFPERISVKFST